MTLIGQLLRVSRQLPVFPSDCQKDRESQEEHFRLSVKSIFPASLSRGLQHKNFLVKFLTLSVLTESFQSLRKVLNEGEQLFGGWESTTWQMNIVRELVPDPQVVLGVIRLGSKKAITSEDGLLFVEVKRKTHVLAF